MTAIPSTLHVCRIALETLSIAEDCEGTVFRGISSGPGISSATSFVRILALQPSTADTPMILLFSAEAATRRPPLPSGLPLAVVLVTILFSALP